MKIGMIARYPKKKLKKGGEEKWRQLSRGSEPWLMHILIRYSKAVDL